MTFSVIAGRWQTIHLLWLLPVGRWITI